MTILGVDHVQVACPADGEDAARRFYGDLLALQELEKPEALRGRGGAWFACGGQQLHVGVDADFAPARKAHPALLVDPGEMDDVARRLSDAGFPPRWDTSVPAIRRFYVDDPWGNRVELVSGERARTRAMNSA